MAINNAIKLIKTVQQSGEFRNTLNGLSPEKVFAFLDEMGMPFTPAEFEEATNMLHVQCQSYEAADQLMQTVFWFRLLVEDVCSN